MKRWLSIMALGLFILAIPACSEKEEAKEVSLDKWEPSEQLRLPAEDKPLKIAVGSMITPKAGFIYYKQLLDYIGENLGRRVQFVDKQSYEEINLLLSTGALDAAFVCSGPYVDGHDEFGLEIVAIPQAHGESVYYSYVIVPSDSPTSSFEELRGKTFAFTDPDSNTGKLVPTYMLARMGETPDSFFREYYFTYAHDKSIRAVALKMVDGAAVDSLIWEYANRTDPQVTSKTRVILKSPSYGIPPFVARPGLAPEIKEGLKRTLMRIHEDEEGRKILDGMMIDRFVEADDSAYDSVREMKAWLAGQPNRG